MESVHRWTTCLVVVALCLTGLSAPGAADDPISRGIQLRKEGRDQEALPFFQRAVREQGAPRAFGQLGTCEQALGLWVEAEAHITRALAHPADPWVQKNEDALKAARDYVQARLGSIEVWGAPPGASVSIDGVPVGVLPLAKPARAAVGQRKLAVEAAGYQGERRTIDLSAGALVREHVVLQPATLAAQPKATATQGEEFAHAPVFPPSQGTTSVGGTAGGVIGASPTEAPTATQPRDVKNGQWRQPAAWVALGLAAASLGTGVTFHVLYQTRTATYNRADATGVHVCNRDASGNFVGPNDCGDAFNGAASARTLMFVGYSGAVLFGAAAAILFWTAPNADGAGASEVTFGPNAMPRSRLTCGMGPSVAGLACSGSF